MYPSSVCAVRYWTDFITETCNYARLSHISWYGWRMNILTTTKNECSSPNGNRHARVSVNVFFLQRLFTNHDLILAFSGNHLWLQNDDCGATLYLPGLSCTNHQRFNNRCGVTVVGEGACLRGVPKRQNTDTDGCHCVSFRLFMPLCSLHSSGEMHAGERLKETSIKCFIKVLSHWKLPEQFSGRWWRALTRRIQSCSQRGLFVRVLWFELKCNFTIISHCMITFDSFRVL